MSLSSNLVSLDEVIKWFKETDHSKLNKYFNLIVSVVKEVERPPTQVVLIVRDEMVEETKILIDQSTWPDNFHRYQEFNHGDIIFCHNALVPLAEDIIIASYISVFDQTKPDSRKSLSISPFKYWSPHELIAANDAKCRQRIRELREFNLKNSQTYEKKDKSNPASATASRSLSLDSSRLSSVFMSDDEDTHSPPRKAPRMSSTPKSKNSSQSSFKLCESSRKSINSGSIRELQAENNSSDESTIAPSSEDEEVRNLTIQPDKSPNPSNRSRRQNDSFQTDVPQSVVSSYHTVETSDRTGRIVSPVGSEFDVFEDTREHFEQDDLYEFPYINTMPANCKLIDFKKIDTYDGNYFQVKATATTCTIYEDLFESRPDEEKASYINRLIVAKCIHLVCRDCKYQIPFVDRIEVDVLDWIIEASTAEELQVYDCPSCFDSTMHFVFHVEFTISESLPESNKMRIENVKKTRSAKKKKTPSTIDVVLTGISALLYFGQRPEDVLISEYNSNKVLDGIRVAFTEEEELPIDPCIRWWYLARINYDESELEERSDEAKFSIITISNDTITDPSTENELEESITS